MAFNEYAAGFLDGEGSFFIYKVKLGLVGGIQVTNTYLPILEDFKFTYGGYTFKHKPIENRKQLYIWKNAGPQCIPMLEDILPHLREKKPQAELLLKFLKWRVLQKSNYVDWTDVIDLPKRIKDLKHGFNRDYF